MVSRPSGESFLRWRCAKGGSPPQKRCRGAAVASSAGASCGVRAEVLLQLTSGAADASREAPRLRAACSSMSFSSRLATEVMALRTIGEGEALPIVDSQRKLLYCAIPKAGCTQIRALLLRLRGAAKTSLAANPWGSSGVHRQPLPRDDGRLLLRPNDDDYFRFTLVRNPLARLLSAFLMQRGELRRRAKLPTFSSFVGALSAGDVVALSSCDGWLQRRRQIGAARLPYRTFQHWQPQVCSCGLGAGATWDVAQLEDPAAVRRVIAKLRRRGPPAAFEGWGPARNASLEAALLEPTLHSGHSRRSAQRLLLHFTPALAARAAELYAADVSRFGYARDVAAFSARLAVFRSCLGLKSGAAPVDEMLHGGGRPRWSAARIGGCAANASR